MTNEKYQINPAPLRGAWVNPQNPKSKLKITGMIYINE